MTLPPAAPWPNHPQWKALTDHEQFTINDHLYVTEVVDAGTLILPSGRLVVCDPFAAMRQQGNPELSLPIGNYPVKITCADVSGAGDGSDIREAYASLLLSSEPESCRRVLTPLVPGQIAPDLAPDEDSGVPVDAGTVCFVDAAALQYGMPDEQTWYADVFDNGKTTAWFARMDDPNLIRDGIANSVLPFATDGANIVLFHSGWGDGIYPIIGGYSAQGNLVAVHVDLMVIPDAIDAQT